MTRERVPLRREIHRTEISHPEAGTYHVSWSLDSAGRVQEIFLVHGKPGNPANALARDIGIILSLALQHGIPMAEMRDSITRLDDGTPAGAIGSVLDKLMELHPCPESTVA